VPGDEVQKKLKQNINTVHILMVAFQDGTIHDVATKVVDYNKTGGVPRPQRQAVTEHMMQLGE